MKHHTFIEIQQIKYRWIPVLLLVVYTLILCYVIDISVLIDGDWFLLTVLSAFYGLKCAFIYLTVFKKFETRIDDRDVRFRYFPWAKWMVYPWEEIQDAYVREFALIGEYPQGVGGTRQGPGGWVYSMDGTWGLQLVKKSGARILIGTKRPEEIRRFLENHLTKDGQ
ncbi:hypothetical protein [Arsenicibacter rosenii]|uniref:Bacterial Pleckstrin homology domain-containing protein n=1 Tax=Arsenicibacter rosenii TaxID=1750698 RepID=A0A1S2VR80_9BACT|nr:hypothetical protein [Arsenicibacter rosenii]OIN61271.1 hypothetical protein BLX24_01455 [Arsenicibacter rosenii]